MLFSTLEASLLSDNGDVSLGVIVSAVVDDWKDEQLIHNATIFFCSEEDFWRVAENLKYSSHKKRESKSYGSLWLVEASCLLYLSYQNLPNCASVQEFQMLWRVAQAPRQSRFGEAEKRSIFMPQKCLRFEQLSYHRKRRSLGKAKYFDVIRRTGESIPPVRLFGVALVWQDRI
jgi:hypothetical protein